MIKYRDFIGSPAFMELTLAGALIFILGVSVYRYLIAPERSVYMLDTEGRIAGYCTGSPGDSLCFRQEDPEKRPRLVEEVCNGD